MEKLQQVLKYKFWILLFVALVLPLVGWSTSRSGLIAEAEDRTKVLNTLATSLKVVPEDPNGEWQRQLEAINVEQQKQALIAWRTLFDRQKPFMVWPSYIDDPAKIEEFQAETYRERYVDDLEIVHQIVNPADEKWQNGLVLFPEDLLPHPNEEWKLQAPSSKQMEAAQEDLWLLTALLRCIASVNEGSATPFDAPIREIVELHLRGGTKGAGATSAPAPAPGGKLPGGMLPPGGMPQVGMPPGNRPGGGGGFGEPGNTGIANPAINADEVLGPERQASDAKPGAPTTTPSGPPAPGAPGMKNMPVPGGPGAQTGDALKRTSAAGMDRYRDDSPEFKTRGFTLQVIMDLRSVPELLVALSNCEGWPVNILRVHEADYKDEDLIVVDAGGGDVAPRPMQGGAVRPERAGFGPPPRGGMGARPGDGGDNAAVSSRSPMDDPTLARVSIVGLMYIFKTPPEPVATTPEAPGAPAAAPLAGDAAAPAADSPATGADSAPSVGDEPASEPEAADKPDVADKPDAATDNDEADGKPADAASDSPDSKSKPKPAPKVKAGEP